MPQMPDSLEELDLLLLTVARERRVQADGVRFQGLRYVDLTLAAYVGESVFPHLPNSRPFSVIFPVGLRLRNLRKISNTILPRNSPISRLVLMEVIMRRSLSAHFFPNSVIAPVLNFPLTGFSGRSMAPGGVLRSRTKIQAISKHAK